MPRGPRSWSRSARSSSPGAIGIPLGLIAGYAGGKLDSVIMRVLDAILAFPVILLAILVVATLGTETINLILTIGFVFIPYFTRLVRANVLALKEREFVEASRASGAADGYLVIRVILPNILSPIVVQASLTMSLAVLIEAALSFLGLGVQEPTPAWGSMLQQSQLYLRQAPWFVLSPGVCIFLAVLAFNLIGDGLRDLLDVERTPVASTGNGGRRYAVGRLQRSPQRGAGGDDRLPGQLGAPGLPRRHRPPHPRRPQPAWSRLHRGGWSRRRSAVTTPAGYRRSRLARTSPSPTTRRSSRRMASRSRRGSCRRTPSGAGKDWSRSGPPARSQGSRC